MSPVLAGRTGGTGVLTLNRPGALHALDLEMCELLIAALQDWRHDSGISLIILNHAGERGFCAGGDIRMLARSGAADGSEARAFFRREYQLNALLMAYPKPIVALMDGVVMGGGVGLSLPCPLRIGTERTSFAMPETGIGLFPDVGGGWHLPRLPGALGMWLALTGARIRAADCLDAGVITGFVSSARLPALQAALTAAPDAPEEVIASFSEQPGAPPGAAHRALIDRTFSAPSVEEIIGRLEGEEDPFAAEQVQILKTKSPQTLKVALRQLRAGEKMGRFEDDLAMEYRIACRVVVRPDFIEGVRAVIIDKDQAPRWSPPTLAGVSERLLDEIFAPLPSEEEWRPLEDA